MVPALLHRLSRQLSCLRTLQGRCRTFAALPQEANDHEEEKIKVTVLCMSNLSVNVTASESCLSWFPQG